MKITRGLAQSLGLPRRTSLVDGTHNGKPVRIMVERYSGSHLRMIRAQRGVGRPTERK